MVAQLVFAVTLLVGSVMMVDAMEWLQFSSPGFESVSFVQHEDT